MKTQKTKPHAVILTRALTAVALLGCAAALTLSFPVQAGNGNNGNGKNKATRIIPPNQEAFGTSYSELAGAWWDWAINQPPDMNPILDETGAFAAVGQDGNRGLGKKIFFLAGNFGGETVRHVTIPKGKALFFPVLNGLWIAPEEGNTEESRQAVNNFLGFPAELSCTIDGVPVADLQAYRAQSPPGGSPFHIQAGSLLESLAPDFYVPRGYLPGSVADGYWLLVELGDGDEHVIQFSGKSANPDAPFELSVTYYLTVENKHHGNGKGKD